MKKISYLLLLFVMVSISNAYSWGGGGWDKAQLKQLSDVDRSQTKADGDVLLWDDTQKKFVYSSTSSVDVALGGGLTVDNITATGTADSEIYSTTYGEGDPLVLFDYSDDQSIFQGDLIADNLSLVGTTSSIDAGAGQDLVLNGSTTVANGDVIINGDYDYGATEDSGHFILKRTSTADGDKEFDVWLDQYETLNMDYGLGGVKFLGSNIDFIFNPTSPSSEVRFFRGSGSDDNLNINIYGYNTAASDDKATIITQELSGYLSFEPEDENVLGVTIDGNVGIGTTSPQKALQVEGACIRLQSPDSSYSDCCVDNSDSWSCSSV